MEASRYESYRYGDEFRWTERRVLMLLLLRQGLKQTNHKATLLTCTRGIDHRSGSTMKPSSRQFRCPDDLIAPAAAASPR